MGRNSQKRREAKKRKAAKQKSPQSAKNITQASVSRLDKARRKYAREWSAGNAAKFEAEGHYQWMASFLGGYSRILEVGAGDGRSTLSLVSQGHKVISVDENPLCLNLAEERLRQGGVSVVRIKRERVTELGEHGYSIAYTGLPVDEPQADAVLIEGDITNDPELVAWLTLLEPFDGVACWLIGTHSARALNRAIDLSVTPTPMHYRIQLQNRVYELADDILRPGGVLHVVDRGDAPSDDARRNDLLNSHRDQASVTTLDVRDIAYRPYEEPEEAGVGMCHTITEHTRYFEMKQLSLQSILSYKPME